MMKDELEKRLNDARAENATGCYGRLEREQLAQAAEIKRLRESVERLEQHVQFARAKQARHIKPTLFRMVKARRK